MSFNVYDKYSKSFTSPSSIKRVFAVFKRIDVPNPDSVFSEKAENSVRIIWCADDRDNAVFVDVYPTSVEVTRLASSVILPEETYNVKGKEQLEACCSAIRNLVNALVIKGTL